jgi:threonine aldolase
MINLISDTATKPTPEMLRVMLAAEVGDDVFGEDPSVNALEAKVADLFGKAAAVFCPSGTMTNQIAIKAHTQPLDEIICEESSHVFQYEVGGYAFHSGVAINLLQGEHGKINAEQIADVIKPAYDWLPRSRLVVLENTANKGGGSYYTAHEIAPISVLCRERGLRLHLDGARLFNALVETSETPRQVGAHFDSISICLSKGLGAPVGSLLIGEKDFIRQARRLRKAFGGGMRQAGYLAAAGIYALDNHVGRLKIDHEHARRLGETLARMPYVSAVRPVRTNIVIFDLRAPLSAAVFLEKLAAANIKASAFGPRTVRFVTHLDISEEMVKHTVEALERMR